jgi:hypothetical protein
MLPVTHLVMRRCFYFHLFKQASASVVLANLFVGAYDHDHCHTTGYVCIIASHSYLLKTRMHTSILRSLPKHYLVPKRRRSTTQFWMQSGCRLSKISSSDRWRPLHGCFGVCYVLAFERLSVWAFECLISSLDRWRLLHVCFGVCYVLAFERLSVWAFERLSVWAFERLISSLDRWRPLHECLRVFWYQGRSMHVMLWLPLCATYVLMRSGERSLGRGRGACVGLSLLVKDDSSWNKTYTD